MKSFLLFIRLSRIPNDSFGLMKMIKKAQIKWKYNLYPLKSEHHVKTAEMSE